jgi:hypothetical protein
MENIKVFNVSPIFDFENGGGWRGRVCEVRIEARRTNQHLNFSPGILPVRVKPPSRPSPISNAGWRKKPLINKKYDYIML